MRVATLARRHRRIGLDSNVLIYALEGSGPEAKAAGALLDAMAAGSCSGVMSTLGLVEILVGPARQEGDALVQRYADELVSLEGLDVAGIDRDTSVEAAHLRAAGMSLADAIHLATAEIAGAGTFVTNDRRIRGTPRVTVTYLSDLAAGA